MLRTNICPQKGLSNGAVGRVYSVLGNGLRPIEKDVDVISGVSSASEDSCEF